MALKEQTRGMIAQLTATDLKKKLLWRNQNFSVEVYGYYVPQKGRLQIIPVLILPKYVLK